MSKFENRVVGSALFAAVGILLFMIAFDLILAGRYILPVLLVVVGAIFGSMGYQIARER